jgi:cellulose synthase (UDP-forming)
LHSFVCLQPLSSYDKKRASVVGSRRFELEGRVSEQTKRAGDAIWLWLVLFLVVGLLGLMAFIPLTDTNEAALSLVMVGAGLLLLWIFPQYRVAAMLLSGAASGRYFWWRIVHTVNTEGIPYLSESGHFSCDWRAAPDSLISIALLCAEGYGFFILLGGFFQTVARKDREPSPIRLDDPSLPTVDIFVPSYNEDIDILRRTLTGALAIDYPKKRVWLLDDTRTNPEDHKNKDGSINQKGLAAHETMRAERQKLARTLGFGLITRDSHEHAKAGNINHALACTSGELITIFDADHIPVRSFLEQTVGFFENPKVALVQTPHHFYNSDPFERNLYLEGQTPPEQALFYHLIQKGNDFWNSAFFCGSCAVLRRSALEDVGGIAVETVTEDAHTALKMHAKGWESVYLDIPLAAGLATESFAAHITQRSRWAIGMVQILRRDFPMFKRGLTLAQRINYTIAASHFLYGLPRVIYLIAPASYLLLDLHPVLASARDILVFAAPHLILSVAVSSVGNRNTRYTFWPEVYETAMAAYSAYVTTWALFRKNFKFAVTDKGLSRDKHTFDWRSARPVLVFLVLNLVSVILLPYLLVQRPDETETILLAEAWTIFNLILLFASVAVAYERPERRSAARLNLNATGYLNLSSSSTIVTPTLEEPAPKALEEVPLDLSDWLESEAQTDGRITRPAAQPAVKAENLLEVVVEDMSEGGAKLVLNQEIELPPQIQLVIPGLEGEVALSAAVLTADSQNGRTSAGIRFLALTDPQRQAVIAHMFTGPERWIQDAFQPDSILKSIWLVLGSPFVSFFPTLLGRKKADQAGNLLVNVSKLLPTLSNPKLLPALTSNPRGGVIVLLGGLISLSSGLMIGMGVWDLPTKERLQLTVAEGHEIAALDRVEELDSAYDALKRLSWQARTATYPFSPGLKPTWQRHLWSLQYHFALADEADPLPAEPPLKEACIKLVAAGQALNQGTPPMEVRKTLDEVDIILETVPEALAQSRNLMSAKGRF